MPKSKKLEAPETQEQEAAVEETQTEETSAPKSKKVSKDSVTVKWGNGERTYSREIHGDDFEDRAKELAAQYPDATIA
jgi:hypothetical protein